MRERRYKTVCINARDVVTLFIYPRYRQLVFEGIPEDFEIVAVFSDSYRESINIILYHETFDIVPDCEFLPTIVTKIIEQGSWRDKTPLL